VSLKAHTLCHWRHKICHLFLCILSSTHCLHGY